MHQKKNAAAILNHVVYLYERKSRAAPSRNVHLFVFLVEAVQDGCECKLCVFGFRLDVPAPVISYDRHVA